MNLSVLRRRLVAAAAFAGLVLLPITSLANSTFTFQGELQQNGVAIHGDVDLSFRIYEDNLGNSQLGNTYSVSSYPVADGILTIDLLFNGVQFSDYAGRWLEIEVDGQVLSPLIEMLPAPYADSTNRLQGYPVSNAAPQGGQVLKWNGAQWTPQPESGGSAYSAGAGLLLSGSTFAIDFSQVASRTHDHYGASWSGSTANYALNVIQSSPNFASTAIVGQHTGSQAGIGVEGTSTHLGGIGVRGAGMKYGVVGDGQGLTATIGVLGNASNGANSVGVKGITSGTDGIAVFGDASDPAGPTRGVRGRTASPSGIGVLGEAPGLAINGVATLPTGVGIRGNATAATGNAIGVHGTTNSDQGLGVLGEANGLNAFGVRANNAADGGSAVGAYATATNGNGVAVIATSAAAAGYGVIATGNVGILAHGEQYAVHGKNAWGSGTAVFGQALANGGVNVGVRGSSASDAGIGVFAENTSSTGPAQALFAANTADGGVTAEVRAQGAGAARAVDALSLGTASDASALRARLTAPASTGDAIRAVAVSSSAKAGRFENVDGASSIALAGDGSSIEATGDATIVGDVAVFGTLSKGGGSFRIDHPLDPANKYLLHSFVESPDMMNVYNGNIVTDAQGFATVDLPDWFEALNRDFRYQLTAIGEFAQVIVAEKLRDNRFVIRSSVPGVEVSWQVTGIRQDAWANAHRIPLEVEKRGADKGRYLHPLEHGKPAARKIGAADPDASK